MEKGKSRKYQFETNEGKCDQVGTHHSPRFALPVLVIVSVRA